MRFLAIFSLLFTLIACSDGRIVGPDDAPPPQDEGIQSGPVSGQFFNGDWTFNQGIARIRTVGGAKMYLIDLWEETFSDPCDPFVNPARTLLFILPSAVGSYTLNNNRTVTFSGNSTNLVATQGIYKLTSFNEEEQSIIGGIQVKYDNQNSVNGSFKVALCP
ncbi:MAG: hypothetical protein KDD37_10435 [Bdellovibrionales bacterium]|nr:hypothetical protein [Bdellovibrionales bacterium]